MSLENMKSYENLCKNTQLSKEVKEHFKKVNKFFEAPLYPTRLLYWAIHTVKKGGTKENDLISQILEKTILPWLPLTVVAQKNCFHCIANYSTLEIFKQVEKKLKEELELLQIKISNRCTDLKRAHANDFVKYIEKEFKNFNFNMENNNVFSITRAEKKNFNDKFFKAIENSCR